VRIPRVLVSALAVAAAAVPLVASSADAQQQQQQQRRVRGVVRIAGEYGGDKIGEFEYADGSTPDVIAGGGLLITGGAAFPVLTRGTHSVEAQVNLGLKWRTIPPATNQDANWLRFPLEGLLYYRTPVGVRLGAGATVHLHNVLAASGEVLNDRVEFENTPGLLLQAEYVRRNIAFDLRYTALQYKVAGGSSGSLDASSIGAGLSFFFGR